MEEQPEKNIPLESHLESVEKSTHKVIAVCVAGALVPGLGHAILFVTVSTAEGDRTVLYPSVSKYMGFVYF